MQITLKSILVAVVIVSIACAILFAVEASLAFWLLIVLATNFSAMLTGLIVYDHGYSRAFAIGALPILVVWTFLFLLFEGEIVNASMATSLSLGFLIVASCGGSSMLVRRMATPGERSESKPGQDSKLLLELTVGCLIGLLLSGAIGLTVAATPPAPMVPVQVKGGVI